jgi:predicted DNA-binding transcriptional regulator YafY
MERMMRIHRKIDDREYPNCTKMSAEFGVSVRTVKRDIDFMSPRMGISSRGQCRIGRGCR